jgi:GNAT superfamily N-acetyltransferase
MCPVRRLLPSDSLAVARLASDKFDRQSNYQPLIRNDFDRRIYEAALREATSPIWVDDANGRLLGHLYGATLADSVRGVKTWTGPDGWSATNDNSLKRLLTVAYPFWRTERATHHVVWSTLTEVDQWEALGYQTTKVRGIAELSTLLAAPDPELTGLTIRRGSLDDLETAIAFDHLIDDAQGVDLASLTESQQASIEQVLAETLDDPETHYYLLEDGTEPIAQCLTFPFPPMRGCWDGTIFLSDVAVALGHRGHGYAKTLVRRALRDALEAGFTHAEVHWAVHNIPSQVLWTSQGFTVTYVQLERALD